LGEPKGKQIVSLVELEKKERKEVELESFL